MNSVNRLRTLWRRWTGPVAPLHADEAGVVQPANYLLLVTIVGIGAIAGLTAIRDSVVGEFGDLAAALESIDQSFSIEVNGVTIVFDEDTAAGVTTCLPDTEEAAGGAGSPVCIVICLDASDEGAGGAGGP